MKAQISLEYLLVVSIIIGAILPFFYYSLSFSSDTIKISQANAMVDTLVSTANYLYSLGPGAQACVSVYIPKEVVNISIENKTILVKVKLSNGLVSDVFLNSKANVSGSLPISEGRYDVFLRMTKKGYVLIGLTIFGRSVYYEESTEVISGTALNSTDCLDADDSVYYEVQSVSGEGETSNYSQSQTTNITGINTTSADFTSSLDGANYNVTSSEQLGTFTSHYNQSSSINITGNASTTSQATINSYLDVNGDGLTWDITKAEIKTAPLRNSTMGGDTGTEAWVTSATVTTGTASYGYNSTGGNPSPSYYHKARSTAAKPADITFFTNQSFDYTLGVPDSVTLRWDYELIGNSFGTGSQLDVILFKPDGTSVTLDTVTLPASAVPWTTRTITVGTENFTQSGTYEIQLKSRLVAASKGTANWLQAQWDNVFLNFTHYAVSVEHNATISYSGTLNSINVSINFTSTLDDAYQLYIYNFTDSGWDTSPCQSQAVTANTYYTKWCNVTDNPQKYVSSDNKVRIRINSTASGQGTLKEEYVQYYVTYTAAYANISVEHNSSTISEDPASITSINVTTVLKTNVSEGIPFTLFIYNFNTPAWEQCSQASVGVSYIQMECNITANPSYYVSGSRIRVRLNSSGETTPHEMMEDYLVYRVTSANYFLEVRHTSQPVEEDVYSISSINVSLNWKSSAPATYGYEIFNFTSSQWISCFSGSVGTEETTIVCNVTDAGNFLSSTNRILVRLLTQPTAASHVSREDYLEYGVSWI